MPQCPICKSEAEEIDLGLFEGAGFSCKRHGEFRVADSVFKESRARTRQAEHDERSDDVDGHGRSPCARTITDSAGRPGAGSSSTSKASATRSMATARRDPAPHCHAVGGREPTTK
jgi:hypothetical protein